MLNDRVINCSDILKQLGLPVTAENERIINISFTLLNYLKVGDVIETSYGKYKKMTRDMIFIESDFSEKEIIDTLEKSNIIKIAI